MRLPQDQEQQFFIEKGLQQLSFDNMVNCLCATIANFPDKRTGKNTRYSIEDAALGTFSVFFTQNPSFLSFQNSMQKAKGESNARTLFAMDKIPSDNHIRDLMDVVAPELVFPVFHYILEGINKLAKLKTDILIASKYSVFEIVICPNLNSLFHSPQSSFAICSSALKVLNLEIRLILISVRRTISSSVTSRSRRSR